MPGHPVPAASLQQTKDDVAKLEKLFDEHDVVFLLMDSRESRWLPTVLGAAKGKIVMNAALGFDSFLVMRHGVRSSLAPGERLGCYYCNDIVAPADTAHSTRCARSHDRASHSSPPQQPSNSSRLSSNIPPGAPLHFPPLSSSSLTNDAQAHRTNAPAPAPQNGREAPDPLASGSVLGLVPHQLRGFLAEFRNMPIKGAAYSRCTGCSDTVVEAYEKQGFAMMLRAFNEPGFLETLTGLDQLYKEGEDALNNVDWDVGDEEEDDDM